jgi:hypothetical protein
MNPKLPKELRDLALLLQQDGSYDLADTCSQAAWLIEAIGWVPVPYRPPVGEEGDKANG